MATIDSYPQTPVLDGTELIPAFRNGKQVAVPSGLFGANSPLPGKAGLSAYQQWLQAGNVGSPSDFLASLTGATGKSAYQLWIAAGNVGTVNDFLTSLRGPPVSIAIGTVTAGAIGQAGSVTIDPTSTATKVVLNFVLPVASGGFAVDA